MLSGKSPGGSDEKTGKTSALSERLTIGTVDVICTEPVKLLRLSRGPMLAAPCAFGASMKLVLPKESPVARSSAVTVTSAEAAEGFAYATSTSQCVRESF